MYRFTFTFLILAITLNIICGEKHHPHLHKEVVIVDYHGPTNKHLFSLFKKAEVLEVYNSTLTSSPSHLYSLLPHLRKVHVENNTYEDVDYDTVLHGANALEEFYCINIKIPKIHLEVLRILPRLKICVVRGLNNPYPIIKDNSLNETQLEIFEFSKNGLETVEDLAFNGLSKLKELNLADNKLRSVPKEALVPLQNLEILNLAGNQIKTFTKESLPKLDKLQKLDLSRNPLTQFTIDGIGGVAPKLTTLIVTGTPLPEAELKTIKEKLNVQIIDQA
ncbi:hypothetical protein HHI36_019781 [Cryptolaemus montrouzieri]|uniref:Uncharacterized protein n=1 Tax=Cryptolaemus montrouzieri TaxID=559131 RepID=A0ABD2N8C6_9CUCU